jgi:hypothetical protein
MSLRDTVYKGLIRVELEATQKLGRSNDSAVTVRRDVNQTLHWNTKGISMQGNTMNKPRLRQFCFLAVGSQSLSRV